MVFQRVVASPPPPPAKEVLYIGSAVPLETSEGLDAIQQPLRSRYPVHDEDNIQGILSTLTVTLNGIQLRYKSDPSQIVFFPFSALSLCAAVRCIQSTNAATSETTSRFVSLTQAAADGVVADKPAIFTTITRRTKGRQVLECHGFITVTPKDAMDLVQWTSAYDKRYKQQNGGGSSGSVVGGGGGGGGSAFMSMNGAHTESTHDISRGDVSFRGETASLPEYPVNLVAGEPIVHTAPQAFYTETPKEGYFYSTKKAQVKKFSIHKFGKNVAEEGGGDPVDNGKLGYAGSHVSLPVTHPPPPMHHPPLMHHPPPMNHPPPMSHPPPMMVPPPGMVRPVLVPGPPPPPPMMYPRPRFFSPPPPPAFMRAQPVPVFVPPPSQQHPGLIPYNGVARGGRSKSRDHRSRHSSASSSSASSSSDRGKHRREKHHHHHHRSAAASHLHEDSSVISSRPVTPPTDYESAPPRMARVSRKDEHHMRQSYLRELNGPNRGAMTIWPPGRKPQGFYVVPINSVYGAPTLPRTKSVPPPTNKSSKKEKKSKKKKSTKNNKNNKNGGENIEVEQEDPEGVLPYRDFHTLESQAGYERSFSRSAAERAFSKSLAAETRNTSHGDAFNAYTINQNGVAEGEFPVMY